MFKLNLSCLIKRNLFSYTLQCWFYAVSWHLACLSSHCVTAETLPKVAAVVVAAPANKLQVWILLLLPVFLCFHFEFTSGKLKVTVHFSYFPLGAYGALRCFIVQDPAFFLDHLSTSYLGGSCMQ